MSETTFPAALDVFPTAAAIGALQQSDTLPTFGKHSGLLRALGSAIAAVEARTFGIEINVVEYGADPTGATNSTTAIHNARDALPANGGTLLFPVGTFLVTALSFKDKPIFVRGTGGRGQDYSSGDPTRAPTRIKSTTNGPIVSFTETSKTSIESCNSGISDIAIMGSNAGGSQVGLVIDNRGQSATNVEVAGCGLDGIRIADCVSGTFTNVLSFRNGRHGWMLDPTLGTGGGPPAIANNSFFGCSTTGNTSDGWHLRGQVMNCSWFGGDIERNTGWGIYMEVSSGSDAPRSNEWYGMHDELNATGSWRTADSNPLANHVRYAWLTSGKPSFSVDHGWNKWSGPDMSLSGAAQRPVEGVGVMSTHGAINSSDIDYAVVRNRDDSIDGVLRVAGIISTHGLAVDPDDDISDLAVPQTLVDSYCVANGSGLTTRNAASNGNYQLISGGADDHVQISGNSKQADFYGDVKFLSTKIGFYNTAPIVKPAATGSRGGNAALASLLTQLAALGIITDSTSA